MLFSDLLPYLIGQGPVGTGPQLPNVPKAQSSFTGQNVPAVRMSTPSELMAAFNQMAQTPSEIKLREAQAKLAGFQGTALDQQVEFGKKLPASWQNVLQQLAAGQGGAAGDAAKPAVWGDIGGGAAGSGRASVGGDSSSGGETDSPAALVKQHESEGLANRLGISPYDIGVGGADLSKAPRDENGFPTWEGQGNSHAAGAYQFQPATWAQYAQPLGIKDFSPASQDAVFRAAYLDKGFGHWAPYNKSLAAAIRSGAGRAGPGQPMSGGSTAPIPGAGAGGGGASPLAAVPDFSGRFAGNEGAAYAPASVFGSLNGGGAAAPGAPIQLAQNGPMQPGMLPPGVPPVTGGAPGGTNGIMPPGVPPGIPTAPPPGAMAPVFGAFAPPAAAAQPGTLPGGMATGGAAGQFRMSPLQAAIVEFGVNSRMAKMGDVADPIEKAFYNSPQYAAQKAGATAEAENAVKLKYAAALAAEGKRVDAVYNPLIAEKTAEATAKFTDFYKARMAALSFPAGSPEREQAEQAALNTAGIKPYVPPDRPGMPGFRFDLTTQHYVPDYATQIPRLPEGVVGGPTGVTTVPGAPEAARQMAVAGRAPIAMSPTTSLYQEPLAPSAAAPAAPGAANPGVGGAVPSQAAAGIAQPGMLVQGLTPGQVTGQESLAAAGTKALDESHAAELAANRRTQSLGQMAEAMRGFTPGASAELKLSGYRIFKDLGFDAGETVPPAELFKQAAQHLQIVAAPKGQGSVSNYERNLFASAVPAMTNSPEMLVKAIDIAKRLDDYDRAVAQIHRDAAKDNKGLPHLIDAQQRVAALGPPLSPGEMVALESIKKGEAPKATAPAAQSPAPAPTATGPGGQKLILRNGAWEPVK